MELKNRVLNERDLRDRELTRALQKSYPKTPEQFRQTVQYAVKEAARASASNASQGSQTGRSARFNSNDSSTSRRMTASDSSRVQTDNSASRHMTASGSSRRSRRRLFIALPAAALLILGCGTAIATGRFSLGSWLDRLGANEQTAEEYVQTNPAVTYTSDEPLVNIQEYYFDGNRLVLVANAADGSGKRYSSKDHAHVNGIDCLVDYYENPDNSSEMIYDLALSEEILQSVTLDENGKAPLSVRMRFYTDHHGTVQECHFDLQDVDMNAKITHVPDQTIQLEKGYVEVTDLKVSLSEISGHLHFALEGEDAEKSLKYYTFIFELADDSGNIAYSAGNDSHVSCSISNITYENGTASRDLTFSVQSLNSDSDSLTLTPYSFEEDEEGKVPPDTRKPMPEKAFSISLKTDTQQ